jgi:hypothetical protein
LNGTEWKGTAYFKWTAVRFSSFEALESLGAFARKEFAGAHGWENDWHDVTGFDKPIQLTLEKSSKGQWPFTINDPNFNGTFSFSNNNINGDLQKVSCATALADNPFAGLK